MSYEDLEEARAKRAEKEATKDAKGKGKGGRKPKNVAPEIEDASSDKENRGRKRAAPEADAPQPKTKRTRMSAATRPDMPEPRTPVAQML